MNRLDMAQMATPDERSPTAVWMIWPTYGAAAVACLLALVSGLAGGHNPTDQFFSTMAALSGTLLIVDAWAAVVAVVRRNADTPLRIPTKTPAILAVVHLAAWGIASDRATFDVLYELVWVSDTIGHYRVNWWNATLVVIPALVSLVLAVFETRLVRWVLVSEMTAVGQAAQEPAETMEDVELGQEHFYEAQVLLNNLGYDVSPITGELSEATSTALVQFQSKVGLPAEGQLTARTMIELRNRWRDAEGDQSAVVAVSEHALRRSWQKLKRLLERP